ncbi:Peptidase C15, pyroglutamyl peptidase I-like [Phaffia rhodozyma]|uniref:Peptidase C15, pyroglutamyl peptidase I-like n=1 Tax=Phaffia rhodozyma TaxID=264483 RepID=A0A0F7SG26_PHARH|nr:Peptidase C15, pyroglutamyl peptidase I-like [Phaffia rhodozyma]
MTARHLHGRVLSTSPSPISSISSDEPLPTTTLPSPSPVPDRKIEITFVGPVDVTYEKVALMVTELHQTDEFDAFVHVGVGRSGELRVEQRSRRVGYDKPGYDGRLCEIVDLESGTRGIKTWPMEGHKDEIRSKIDCDKLVKWLRSQMDVKHVLPSTDAGLYLCEYIYGMSLAQSILHTKSGDGRSPAPVLFVHVPTLKTDANSDAFYTESEVSEILERVCWWVGSTV